jgi:hypothetical protein
VRERKTERPFLFESLCNLLPSGVDFSYFFLPLTYDEKEMIMEN